MPRQQLCWKLILILLVLPAVGWTQTAPVVGELLAEIRLPTPESADRRAYLGLAPGDSFRPAQVAGKLLIIEIFSMYCPHCQREAPAVNRLYQTIQASPELRNQVKMIGIGVGNSAFEVDHFRKHYQIAFPLFPDEEFVIHQALGGVRTPFFIITAVGSTDAGKVLWTGSGTLEPVNIVVDRLNGLLHDR